MDFKTIEKKWQDRWRAEKCFTPLNDGSKKKFFNLIEFPFPSGDNLHMGHMVPFVSMDVMARYWRMKGRDVLYPLGFDALGIASERYATKLGVHPSESVKVAIGNFIRDADMIGWSYDPECVISTSDPEYIKWTQWQFIQFFKMGLAYKSELPMNWCPACRTNFTNEELEDGNCERCKGPIEKKMKLQWNLAITKYADRLVDDLELVDYPERVKTAQRNWVGRSFGAEVDFGAFAVYTTRIDTLFGSTFCVIAPEHEILAAWLSEGRIENADEVRAYITASRAKTEIERTDATREKTGVLLKGITATNPFNGEKLPVFVADYVLANYATGTVVGVPSEDERDLAFAQKYGLPVIEVIDGDGRAVNSGFLNGMTKDDAIAEAIKFGIAEGFAKAAKKYKMTDWGFSRQMYWGEPIPLVHCGKCGWQPVPDSELPVMQPFMTDFHPTPEGESALARAADWVKAKCPVCDGEARRETDTMPGWAGSSWYFMRYLDPHNDQEFCKRERLEKWMPVDHYNGPMEHVTRHMIYSRFWYKALFDLGLVTGPEPYAKRTINGLLMAPDGRKMSKSLGNLVKSYDVVGRAGADAARLTTLFLSPFEQNRNWSDDTLRGCERFLSRVAALFDKVGGEMDSEQERLMNQLAKDMGERIENMQFNTAIAAMMEYINNFSTGIPRLCYEMLIMCLNPFAPHLAEELWEKLGNKDMLVFHSFPVADETKLAKKSMTIVVSVNGKRRAEIVVPLGAAENDVVSAAKNAGDKFITGEVSRVIYVPNKMVNFVL
ncbi:MAG: leucine--tRNA ligase [Alphaproteobacteria bacterium]|nr:leucine--tRNA ligase [Alphaproteobacteria bacterium]